MLGSAYLLVDVGSLSAFLLVDVRSLSAYLLVDVGSAHLLVGAGLSLYVSGCGAQPIC